MEYGLGVDLGTTYTAAAVRHNGHAEIARLGSRRAEIPSLVFLHPDGRFLIGEAAERRGAEEPGRLAREFKRRVGDPVPLLVGGSPYPAHALMARLLEEVLGTVTRQQEGPPSSVTVTYPANWGPYKRELLSQAVRLADMGNVTLRAEPEAAAVRYAAGERVRPGEIVAVYDLGGGTFDAAVLRKTETGFEVLGEPEGIEQLGGIDFDEAVLNHVTATLGQHVSDLDPDDARVMEALSRLRRDCVEAKEALSYDTEVMVPVALPTLHTRVRLNRSEFETMITPALMETVAVLRRALHGAGVEPDRLRSVLLAGGSSRIPLVSQLLSVEFGRPVVLDPSPEHSIALGAALVTGRDVVGGASSGVAVDPVPSGAVDPGDDGTVGDSRKRGRMAQLISKLGRRAPGGDEAAVPVSGAPVSGAPVSAVPVSAVPVSAVPVSAVPVSAVPVSGVPVTGVPVTGVPVTGVPVTGVPAVTGVGPGPIGSARDYVPDVPSRGVARVPVLPRPAEPLEPPPAAHATGRAAVPTSGPPATPSAGPTTATGRASVSGPPAMTPAPAAAHPVQSPPAPPRIDPPRIDLPRIDPPRIDLPRIDPPRIVPPAGGFPSGVPGPPVSGGPGSWGSSLPGVPSAPGLGGFGPGLGGLSGSAVAPSPGPDRRSRFYLAGGIVATIVALLAAVGVVHFLNRDDPRGANAPAAAAGPLSGPFGTWERRADLPVSVEGAATAAWKGRLWVTGGQRDNDVRLKIKEVYVYDPASDAWTTGPPLPTPISHASLVATPSGLYFIGGWVIDGGSTQVLRLNDAATAWEEQPPLPETRVAGVGGFTGSEVVYAGGTRKGTQPDPADTVWALRGGSWVEIGRLQKPRQKLMAAGNGLDNLWILGGRNIQTNEKFGTIDIVGRNGVQPSSKVLDPPIDSAAGIYVEGSGICLIGGQTPNGGFSNWWCEQNGLAERLPALDPQRGSLAAAMIGRTVYVIGGYGKGFVGLNRLEAFTFPPA